MQLLSNADQRIIELLPALKQSLEESLAPQLRKILSSDDLVQETFIRASKKFDDASFDNDQQLFAWLKQIATRVAISSIRNPHSKEISIASYESALANELVDSGAITASSFVIRNENFDVLALCIGKLSQTHRSILQLRYFDKLSFAEIASELSISESSARGLHRNAVSSLRRALVDVSKFFSTI